MSDIPDHTAVRVALWRALHVERDPAPHIFEDVIGLQLADPPADWRQRPDMDPVRTATMRASIAARARFVEDLVATSAVKQYVILGAGLDTFAQRQKGGVRVFEIDRAATQDWKRRRLQTLGLETPTFVPVDFEKESWWERLCAEGFDCRAPAVVASTGVSMYITKDAIKAMLRQMTALAKGSHFAMTYLLPTERIAAPEQPIQEAVLKAARASGTPFISLFAPEEILSLAKEAGLAQSSDVSPADLSARYLAGRNDVHLASAEHILVASV